MKYLDKIVLFSLVCIASVTSCNTDELQNLNTNPQALKEIDLNFLFTSAQLGAATAGSSGDNRYMETRTNIGMAAYAIQHLANAGPGIAPGDKYTENVESNDAPFEVIYGDQLKNINEILKQTGPGGYDEGNKTNMRNAARILRASLFHRLTDYYGSVPYFDALKADERLFFPSYDKQRDIYADLLNELDEASAALGDANAGDGFAAADLYYNGDIAKWKKWGYSLMLRLAMRVSNVDLAMANTYVAKAVAGGVFESNDDNVLVPMAEGPGLWVNQNGLSRSFDPGDGAQPGFLSKSLIDWLKGADPNTSADDDPRLMIISGGIANWTVTEWIPINTDPLGQKGMPNGYDQDGLNNFEGFSVNLDQTYSRINYLLLQIDDPYMLMNYGEVELLLAEAAERGIGGLNPGSAEEHYNAGVKASMQMYTSYDPSLTVSDAEVTNYLANYPYAGTSQQKLEMIYEQLWINHFLNWREAWSDWRRTGYPQLTPTNYPGNVTGGTIPQRLKYPTPEVAGNPNFETGSTAPNTYTTRVWWAGGPE